MFRKSMLLMFGVLFCLPCALWAQVDLETLNVALDGTATMSTTYSDAWNGAKAIDTDISTGAHSSAVAVGEWLEIELDQPYDLREIRLTNRTDCCDDRMEGIVVTAINAAGTVVYTSAPVLLADTSPGSVHIFDNDGKKMPQVSIIHIEQTIAKYVQIMEVEAYLYISPIVADDPSPADGASDVLRDSDLSWTPGIFAATHELYLGEAFEDANTATIPTGAALAATSFDPGRFDFGKTYFWRVDEVNGTPDKSVFKGNVWSFEVEPYSIMIPADAIAASASTVNNDTTDVNYTIDGSGLAIDPADGVEKHSMDVEGVMWMSVSGDPSPSLMYEFDQVHKLDKLLIWNSNHSSEGVIGWGIKDLDIQVSMDGVDWTSIAGVEPITRATGLAPNGAQAIDMGLAVAKYVKLNILSNWGGLLPQYGVAEVQFYTLPTVARTPVPASGSVDVLPGSTVAWRAGREAAEHTVSVSTDPNAIADGASATSGTNSLDLTSLDLQLGQTYYWQVDEVNNVEVPSVWAGPVWSLSTPAALVVDDFESYGNLSPNRPFQTWLDGFGYSADEFFPVDYPGNGTGSGAGHDIWSVGSPHFDGTIMETSITAPGSSQSLPVYYDNVAGGVSEVTLNLAQDWSGNGIQTLGLYVHGAMGNTGQLYVKINNTKINYALSADLLEKDQWLFWAIDLLSQGINLQNVTSLTIGVEGVGSGVVYVDDIKLYAAPVETIEPVEPGTEGLVAQYPFEGGFTDTSGKGNDLTAEGDVAIINDPERGNVATFDGVFDGLRVPQIAPGIQQLSFSVWVRLDQEVVDFFSIYHNDGWTAGDLHSHISGNNEASLGANGLGGDLRSSTLGVGTWYHLAYVLSNTQITQYVNGVVTDSRVIEDNADYVFNLGEGYFGAWLNNSDVMVRGLIGQLDEVRFYTTELTHSEVLYLANQGAIYKPL